MRKLFCQLVFEAIFSGQDKIIYKGKTHCRKMLKKGTLKSFKIDGVSYIEQNPDTASSFARRARMGAKIMWIIRGSNYEGYVEDGKAFRKLIGRNYQPVKA